MVSRAGLAPSFKSAVFYAADREREREWGGLRKRARPSRRRLLPEGGQTLKFLQNGHSPAGWERAPSLENRGHWRWTRGLSYGGLLMPVDGTPLLSVPTCVGGRGEESTKRDERTWLKVLQIWRF